jgi:tetratricopeptide (TPR) repeat protein
MESLKESPESLSDLGRHYEAGFLLAGSLRRAGDVIRVAVTLIATETGKHVYSHRYDRQYTVENLFELQEDIATYVAAAIAAPYGVVNRIEWALAENRERDSDASSPPDIDAYEALLAYYAFSHDPRSTSFDAVMAKIEAAAEKNARCSSLWAARSLMLSAYATQDPICADALATLRAALNDANRAVAIDSRNAVAYKALLAAHFHLGHMKRYQVAAEKAIALNPNDDSILAFYAVTQAYGGEYDKALELIERAKAFNMSPPAWYNLPRLFDMFMKGEHAALTAYFAPQDTLGTVWGQGLAKAVYGLTGDGQSLKSLAGARPDALKAQTCTTVKLLEFWHIDAGLKARLEQGWEAADRML